MLERQAMATTSPNDGREGHAKLTLKLDYYRSADTLCALPQSTRILLERQVHNTTLLRPQTAVRYWQSQTPAVALHAFLSRTCRTRDLADKRVATRVLRPDHDQPVRPAQSESHRAHRVPTSSTAVRGCTIRRFYNSALADPLQMETITYVARHAAMVDRSRTSEGLGQMAAIAATESFPRSRGWRGLR
jgi:hypothetical protein